MPKYTRIPTLSGKKLIELLKKNGWSIRRQATHGVAMSKQFSDRTRVTVVPTSNAPLDDGTLAAILGPKQTNIGKKGLLGLVNKYGV